MRKYTQGKSIWGSIKVATPIATGIYKIISMDKNAIEHSFVMARKSSALKRLSPKAVLLAREVDGWLYYDEKVKDIPIYEVLQRRVEVYRKLATDALRDMQDIEREGKLSNIEYFGECTPPICTQSRLRKVRNGIYFVYDDDDDDDGDVIQLAVHEAVADNYMSDICAKFGHIKGDYLFYDATTSAIALNELKNLFVEFDKLINSKESLYATLNHNFSAYVIIYNQLVQNEWQIPKVSAPVNQFLTPLK